MTRRQKTPAREPAKGRPVDRLIAGLSTLGLFASVAVTLWFFLGFAETDPEFAPASSALLLALLLGAFAIIPCAVMMRLSWASWWMGFRFSYGVWTLFLMLPWVGLAVICAQSDWMPVWLTLGPLGLAIPSLLWAVASIIIEIIAKKSRKA